MGLNRKQILERQKAYLEEKLKNRRSLLSGKGLEGPKAEKDTLVRKFKAEIKAADKRLRVIDAGEKRKADLAKIKAERAAAPKEAPAVKKAEKPKKAAEGAKEKKPKAEKKPAAPKEPKAGQGEAPAESPEKKEPV